MPRATGHDHGSVPGITFVDEGMVAVIAVGDMTDLPVQEDEYDSHVDDNTPSDI